MGGLANDIGLTARTIERHLSILEQTYVLHSVGSYFKNIGNGLKKSRKFYFYDLGIRNALLSDFSMPNGRGDIGVVHESFAALQLFSRLKPNTELKFWRNKAGQEIDYFIDRSWRPPYAPFPEKSSLIAPAIKRVEGCHAGPRIRYGAGPIRHPVFSMDSCFRRNDEISDV